MPALGVIRELSHCELSLTVNIYLAPETSFVVILTTNDKNDLLHSPHW